MQFSYATHLAHPVLCRPTHFNISGYASGAKKTKTTTLFNNSSPLVQRSTIENIRWTQVAYAVQNILNCVQKTNKAFMGLELHGGK